MKEIILVSDREEKLLRFLSRELDGMPYGKISSLLRNKDVKINGARVGKDAFLNKGDKITVYISEDYKKPDITPQTIYCDDNVVIACKPRGITSYDFESSVKKSICSAAVLTHRLDTNTEGLIVFAKNESSENEIVNAFKEGRADKIYYAKVHCEKKPLPKGKYRAYLFKDAAKGRVFIYDKKVKGGVIIVTELIDAIEAPGANVIGIRLHTGKTHQIRAHMAYLGYPIIGDSKYGKNSVNRNYGEKKQLLTAAKLSFTFAEDSVLNYLSGKTFSIIPDFFRR